MIHFELTKLDNAYANRFASNYFLIEVGGLQYVRLVLNSTKFMQITSRMKGEMGLARNGL